MQKQAPTPRPRILDDGRSSRCRASACCCSCGCPSAARSRSSRRATAFKVAFPEATQLGRRPTCASPASRSARCARRTLDPSAQPHARDDRDRPQVRAAAHRRAGDPAPEDAARRDLRRADAGPRARRRSPRAGGCPTAQVKPTVELDEIFRLVRPADARGVPQLAAGPGQGRSTAAARTSTTRSATCPASPHDGADVLQRARRPAGRGQPARQEHRRRRSAR